MTDKRQIFSHPEFVESTPHSAIGVQVAGARGAAQGRATP